MKTQVKKSPLLLLVVAALVLLLAVKSVQVYEKLEAARVEEAQLAAQLAEQRQVNEDLRRDLARADDEEFWKQLARENGLYDADSRIFYDVNE